MAARVFVHVGSPKTGTTFLQQVLWSQKDLAQEQGLLLPLEGFFDHYLATLHVRGIPPQPADAERAERIWERILEASSAWAGNVLVSHELLAPAASEQAERALTSFGPDAEIHVVLTARDLVRQIPAEWQEHVKHRSTLRFEEFVDDLRREDPATWFWRVQDFPEVLRRWGSTLPPERVHVVTVPAAGQPNSLLWERFAGLVGLDPASFTTTGLRANPSLGYEQSELLRRVNAELGDLLPLPGPYAPDVKSMFAERVLSQQAGTKLALAGDGLKYAVERSAELARGVEELGVNVVGDLGELVPEVDPANVQEPLPPPGEAAVLAESLTAITGLLREHSSLRLRAGQERRELHRYRDFERETRAHPFKQLLRMLSERWGWAGKARAVYRRSRDRLRSAGAER